MKKILTILLCGIMVLGMAGCGKEKNKFDIGNKSNIKISQNDVTMTIKEGTLTNRSATLVLTNNGDKNFQYGDPYEIEIKKDGEWHKINIEFKGNSKIVCDSKWQIEAITNILKNAVDHSKNASKVTINIEDNNVYSMIEIIDTGDGISKKDIAHIFERFYKGENATSDSIGIGLALAKTIIEEDNGNVGVESNKLGTKFVIKYFKI